MATIAVVYHSGYGHTEVQAKAVARGVESVDGVTVKLIKAAEIDGKFDDLNSADAIIFGAPTYMGSLSGPFKMFMDSTGGVWGQGLWKNKIGAEFTNSGSQSGDKLNSLVQLAIFGAQHGMIWVGLDLMPGNNVSTGSVADLNRLGSWIGAMSQSNGDQGPDVAPTSADQMTAEYLGERVAKITLQFLAGATVAA